MPNRVQWNPGYSVGHDVLDRQHRAILAQCNALADCIADAGPQGDQQFQTLFDALMAQASEHFCTEAALLAQYAYPEMEALHNEQDEFDYLAQDIVTAKNFDAVELQRFLALWWLGHIVGSGKKYRAVLAQPAKA